MVKKYVVLLLSIIMILILHSTSLADDTRKSGLYTYTIQGNGTISIVDFEWENNSGDIYIPSMIDGYNVTSIGDCAFELEKPDWQYRKFSETIAEKGVIVRLPEGIASIGEKAFFNANITNINIPQSVRYIGSGAFAGCDISQFTLDGKHESFATIDGALYNKTERKLIAYPQAKNDIVIPSGIVEIGDYACYKCTIGKKGLGTLDLLPETIIKVGKYAFSESDIYCSRVQYEDKTGVHAMLLPLNVSVIDDYAFSGAVFYDAYNFSSYQYPFCSLFNLTGLNKIGNYAFSMTRTNDINFSTHEHILIEAEIIGEGAFQDFLRYNEWAFAISVTSSHIGSQAFANEASQREFTKRLTINMNLTGNDLSLGSNVFKGNVVVTNFVLANGKEFTGNTLTIPGKLKTIPAFSFANTGAGWKVKTEKVIIEAGITRIGENAFQNDETIISVEMPDTVTAIESYAFSGCTGLTEINLSSSIREIGTAAFERTVTELIVTEGSYAEMWARQNGYNFRYNNSGDDDLSWLTGETENSEKTDQGDSTDWLNP